MHRRLLYSDLEEHLHKRQITVITGMRRVGKSTAVKHLLAQIGHTNKVYLDFEKANNRFVFNQSSYSDIEINLQVEGIDFSQPSVIALDEIQLVPNSTSVIKYLYDTYEIKFIVTGSSSFYLRNHFTESLAGRKTIFEMSPLTFNEFLTFNEVDAGRLTQFSHKPYQPAFYDKYQAFYERYIAYGGFPEVVLAETDKDRQRYLDDVINAHIELDIRLLSDFSLSDNLFKLMRLLANRTGSKIDYSKLGTLLGVNRHKVKDYITLLGYTYFIHTVESFTSNPDRAIAHQPKIYLSDSGLLNRLAQVSSGSLFENVVANQLRQAGTIQYHQTNRSGAEIDFILNGQTAFEVKETPTPHDAATLNYRAEAIGLTSHALIGRHRPASGFRDFIWGGNLL